MRRKPIPSVALRPLGFGLLVIACVIGRYLTKVGPEHSGHEPLSVYMLSIVLFFCASAGAALFFHGRHLFDRVIVSKRWIVSPPPSIEDMQRPPE